jgi:MFS transporter, PPP family, 3-phenylpropionic acid transporter
MNARLLSAHYFFSLAAMGAFGTYITLYLNSKHFSAWQIAVVMTMFTVMRMVSPSIFGWLADHSGKKVPIIRWASIGITLCFSSFFWLHTFHGFLVGMIGMGVFWSAVSPLIEALTFAEIHETPSRYSTIRVWGSMGAVLSVIVAGKMIDLFSINTFLWLVEIMLGLALVVACCLREAPNRLTHSLHKESVWRILKQPGVWGVLVAGFLMSAAHGAFSTFMPIHLSHHHFTSHSIGLLWAVGVTVEIGFFFFPRIIHETPLRQMLTICFVVAVIRFLLLGWMADSLCYVLLAQAMHGITYGVHHIATISAVNRYFSGVHQAKGQTIYSGIAVCGGLVVGQLLSGYAMDHWGGEWAFTSGAMLALLGLGVVLAKVHHGN